MRGKINSKLGECFLTPMRNVFLFSKQFQRSKDWPGSPDIRSLDSRKNF
jgi:hypothetical protein